MKIKEGYLLKKVAGEFIIVPIAKGGISSVMTLNETGAFLFERLSDGADESAVIQALLDEYDTDVETATRDVRRFIASLSQAGVLDD